MANPLTTAALWATLDLYQDEQGVTHQIPTLQLLSAPLENLQQRAERLAPQMEQSPAVAEAVPQLSESTWSQATSHQQTAPTWIITLRPAASGDREAAAMRLGQRLGKAPWPVLSRMSGDSVVLDLRSVFPRWDHHLVEQIEQLGD